MGYKTVTDFYNELADEHIDVNRVIDLYLEIDKKKTKNNTKLVRQKNLLYKKEPDESKEDELVIGGDVKGIDYKLAKCCNPIYGDEIFGFVSTEGTIKIHRKDCPNARHIYSRYRYRVVNARWSGKMGVQIRHRPASYRKRRYRYRNEHYIDYFKREKHIYERHLDRLERRPFSRAYHRHGR